MRRLSVHIGLLTCVFFALAACGGGSSKPRPPAPPPPGAGLSTGPEACVAGNAGDFACSGISLRQRVSLATMNGSVGNDIWGWVDAQSGDEYALMGMTNGTAFINVTNPENPVFLGNLPTATVESAWRDIKVYQDHAYIVADGAGAHGMQVFDLTRLRGLVSSQSFTADANYGDFTHAHNIAINEDTGFAYVVGTNTCGEGLHMIDIRTPINPLFAGCHSDFETHDTQCVSYQGPDVDHINSEVCLSAAKNRVEVVDVTVKGAPVSLSATTYPQLGFVHQAWLTEDHRFLLVGDEFDELNFGAPTRTHVLDVSDLDAPAYVFAYEAATTAIDHNLYVLGNRVFEANYTSGLRVLEFADLANRELMEIAFFDTFPVGDAAEFDGAWSVYPYLPSGNIIVSDISNGLFILSLQ
ncbi:MAG: choice-of-anchor B family protein [Gammaproteobacteria bacterium]|nr:choice-of-anchor B family protein [Gammaproteobacteria bacterium]